MRQADDHDEGLDKTIMLNLALAWVRLGQLVSSAEEGSAMVPVPVPSQAEVNIVAPMTPTAARTTRSTMPPSRR